MLIPLMKHLHAQCAFKVRALKARRLQQATLGKQLLEVSKHTVDKKIH